MAWTDAARAASLAVRQAKATTLVYHTTNSAAYQQIRKEGFRPFRHRGSPYYQLSKRRFYKGGRANAVYVTKGRKEDHWPMWFGPHNARKVVIALRVPTRKLHPDLQAGRGAYYIHGVSAKRIAGVTYYGRKWGTTKVTNIRI